MKIFISTHYDIFQVTLLLFTHHALRITKFVKGVRVKG